MLPLYYYKCKNGHLHEVEARIGEAPQEVLCNCSEWAKRVFLPPNIMLNKWNVDYKFNDVSEEIDGERDAIACGAYE